MCAVGRELQSNCPDDGFQRIGEAEPQTYKDRSVVNQDFRRDVGGGPGNNQTRPTPAVR